jgi:hypothetical protein
MVDFRRLSTKAKDLVEKRGGSESLKQDAEELKKIAKGPGSLSEKAKRAASAIKDPGGAERSGAATSSEAAAATPAEKARATSKVAGEERGKHAHADTAEGVGGGGEARQGAVQSEPQGGGDKPAV